MYFCSVIIYKDGEHPTSGSPHSRHSPSVSIPPDAASEQRPHASVAPQQGPEPPSLPHPHAVATHHQGPEEVDEPRIEDSALGVEQRLSWSPDPSEIDVKLFYHNPEDDEPARMSEAAQWYEQVTALRVPPLMRDSPDLMILGRARLWGLWADSAHLQHEMEYLQRISGDCLMDTHQDGLRW